MTREEALNTAMSCVCGQREQDYGSLENNFALIADFWTAYLNARCTTAQGTVNLNAVDVALMMVQFKAARVCTGTADSFVDMAGYAACACEIATENSKQILWGNPIEYKNMVAPGAETVKRD